MKYILTKDGRILLAPNLYDNGGAVLCSEPLMYETRNAKNEWGCVFCHDVIKQADTIEELCDEFVVVSSLCCSLLNENEKQDIKRFAKSNLYGAIWTDKGLIYVAKMNEKGELVLL